MPDFLNLVKKRKTSFEFENKRVSRDAIVKMLEAARWAPSCTNTQPWHFIIIESEKQINKLMSEINYGFFHETPSAIIALVLKQERCAGPGHACFRGKDSGVHDSFMSIGIAAEHICLMATELGIDSCLLTPQQTTVKKILHVGRHDAVPLLVGLGYEKRGAFDRKRERMPLKDLVSLETADGSPLKDNESL